MLLKTCSRERFISPQTLKTSIKKKSCMNLPAPSLWFVKQTNAKQLRTCRMTLGRPVQLPIPSPIPHCVTTRNRVGFRRGIPRIQLLVTQLRDWLRPCGDCGSDTLYQTRGEIDFICIYGRAGGCLIPILRYISRNYGAEVRFHWFLTNLGILIGVNWWFQRIEFMNLGTFRSQNNFTVTITIQHAVCMCVCMYVIFHCTHHSSPSPARIRICFARMSVKLPRYKLCSFAVMHTPKIDTVWRQRESSKYFLFFLPSSNRDSDMLPVAGRYRVRTGQWMRWDGKNRTGQNKNWQ